MSTAGLFVFSGNSNPELASAICNKLDVPIGNMKAYRAPNGEIQIVLKENVQGGDTYVVQSGSPKPNEHFMELLLMIRALRSADAARITAVIPFFPYTTETNSGDSLSLFASRLLADLLKRAGANRVVTMELHSSTVKGFFDFPIAHLHSSRIFVPHLKELFGKHPGKSVLVDADGKNFEIVEAYVETHLESQKIGFGTISRKKKLRVLGKVEGCCTVLFDDQADTGITLCEGAEALMDQGASEVHAIVTHGIFSEGAEERIDNSPLTSVRVTDTMRKNTTSPKIIWLESGFLFALAINKLHNLDPLTNLNKV